LTRDALQERDPRWASRAVREFLTVPLLVVLGFVILAALSIALDQSHASWLTGPRHALGHVVGKQAASTALSDIATGLVTVTSITFSVLLLAVQQTAANLSPVVFEQFMRRRSNQVYLGFFVGLCVYSYVVLAAVQKDTPPTLGAAVAVLLTVVALLILLTLVYSTLNQMRPVHVVFAIRTRALNARARELELIRRTRRAPQLTGPPGATAFSAEDGHVTAIQLEALDDRLRDQDTAEVELTVTLGQYVVAGEALAQIRGPNGDELAAVVREEVVVLGRQRDADQDATASVDQLANIAWTTGSTAKQSPEVARQALDALRGLLGRWTADLAAAPPPQRVLPVVYPDNDRMLVVDSMLAIAAVAHESQQQQTAARVLDAFTQVLPRCDQQAKDRIADGLREAAPLFAQGAWMPKLRQAAASTIEMLDSVGCRESAEALRNAFRQEHEARAALR